MSEEEIAEAAAHNLDLFMERGPGLYVDYSVVILERDRVNRRVLLGGLGGMGIGEMWVDEEERHQHYTGYEDAPEAGAHRRSRYIFGPMLARVCEACHQPWPCQSA